MNKSECVIDSVNFDVELVGPYSKHFCILYLDDILSVESSKIVAECEEEEEKSYILDFAPDKQYKNTPHFKAEWFTMPHTLHGSLIFIPHLLMREPKRYMQSWG